MIMSAVYGWFSMAMIHLSAVIVVHLYVLIHVHRYLPLPFPRMVHARYGPK